MKSSFSGMIVLSLSALVALVSLMLFQSRKASPSGELTFYCAAGIRKPVELVIQDYQDEFGVTIKPIFAGSGALLSKIRAANLGDLYLAASRTYMQDGRNLQLIEEVASVAEQNVVFVVRKEEEKTRSVKTLDDILAAKNCRIYIADPKVAAISRAAKKMLGKAIWDRIWEAKAATVDTVNLVANGIVSGVGDIGIIWDATANQYDALRAIRVPQFEAKTKQIALSVLNSSKHPRQALHFLRYLTSRDKGLKRFKEMGYRTVEGDKWAETPTIKLFAGGLNRPAIEPIIEDFQEREGVVVEATYNGCGILVGQMKGGAIPDAYFACDTSFMTMVEQHFDQSQQVSGTDMVIIVSPAKQKEANVKTLKDLAKKELKVGICSEKHSALGHLSKRLLDKHSLWAAIQKNVRDSPPTADVLVTQVAAGALDAAIVYKANTSRRSKDLVVIDIADPMATAVQPIAVAENSDYRHLTNRLLARIRSANAKSKFESLGFRWLGDAQKP